MADTWDGPDMGANVGSKDFGPSGKTGGSSFSGGGQDNQPQQKDD